MKFKRTIITTSLRSVVSFGIFNSTNSKPKDRGAKRRGESSWINTFMEPPFDYDPIWKPIHDPKGVVDPNRYVYKIDFISSRTIVFDTTNKQSCSYKPEQDAYWLSSNGKWILCHRIYLTTGRSVKVKNPVNKKNHNPKRSVKATNYGRCDISSSRVRKQF